MPYYKGVLDELAKNSKTDAQEVAARILALRERLEKDLPQRNVLSSLLMATWNIREFGANKKYGTRLRESLLYIAEIISHFDLVAIQEVNQNLADLQELVHLLGGWWDYLVTDVTLGASGNSERIAFLYDGRKVRFDHLAGELALPDGKKKKVVQPARSPFICAFKVGWRRVALCSVHIFYGKSRPDDPRRIKEIEDVSRTLAERNDRRQRIADGEPGSVILLGDFNIFDSEKDKTAAALKKNKFYVPRVLKRQPSARAKGNRAKEGDVVDPRTTNLGRDKHFDQIAFHDPRWRLRTTSQGGGVFDFQQVIYGAGDAEKYRSAMERSALEKFKKASASAKALEKFYRQWRTFQVSDHLPLWVELRTDFADDYLTYVKNGKKSARAARAASKARKEAAAVAPLETPPPIASAPQGKAKRARRVARKAA